MSEKNLFSDREIVLFAIDVMKRQLLDGLIDEEHIPEKVDLAIADSDESKALIIRCSELSTIPHQNDILNATRSFYDCDEDFAAYFETLCKRAEQDPVIKQILNPH